MTRQVSRSESGLAILDFLIIVTFSCAAGSVSCFSIGCHVCLSFRSAGIQPCTSLSLEPGNSKFISPICSSTSHLWLSVWLLRYSIIRRLHPTQSFSSATALSLDACLSIILPESQIVFYRHPHPKHNFSFCASTKALISPSTPRLVFCFCFAGPVSHNPRIHTDLRKQCVF